MDEKTTLNILFVTTECLPFCANGGMAEMAYALPKSYADSERVDIRVVMPLHD